MLKKNDECIIDITDLGNDGEGIGRADGYALFVKGAIPGDKIKALVIKAKKNYGFARIVEILSPSENRVTPECPLAGRCGGCQLQHMNYSAELEWKENKVMECLKRIGGFDKSEFDFQHILGMDIPQHYRNKAQFPVGFDKNGRLITGFYAGHSHNIIPSSNCLIQDECTSIINNCVIEYMNQCHVPAYDEKTHTGVVRHIMIRNANATGEIMVCIIINSDSLKCCDELVDKLKALKFTSADNGTCNDKRITSICININKEKGNVILGRKSKTLYGNDTITDKIGDVSYSISPVSFYQVNSVQTKKLYDTAVEFADFNGNETVYDLYCGIGTISLYVASKVKKVIGVEIVEKAIEDAKKNANLNNINNPTFYAGAAEEKVPELYNLAVESGEQLKADVVILDPPRKGCDEILLETVIKMNPSKIVYVSCDPATLARDAKYICENGYKLEKARPVDMFGRSGHVECVVLMSRVEK